MKTLILAASLIFSSGFESVSTLTFHQASLVTKLHGCELVGQYISDRFVYSINTYQFECPDSIPSKLYGKDHHSAVFINGVGLFCDIDFFELRSADDFDLIIDCN
jgi:hypothetical protein